MRQMAQIPCFALFQRQNEKYVGYTLFLFLGVSCIQCRTGEEKRRKERRGREGRTVECTCAGYVGHAFFLDAVAAVLFSSRRMRPLHTAPIHATLASDILVMFCRSSD
jgi:hypothetical protein